jgi:hypothetical protein
VSAATLTTGNQFGDSVLVGVETLFVRSAISVLLLIAGCTKSNPESCCTTSEQCAAVGLKDVTDCKSGDVCDPNGACVAPQCSTSADCTSPDTPICMDQLCVQKCTVDAECTGLAGTPYCASDGVCVACKDDTQCSADKPICDMTAHACRGCATDTECPSGVCLEQQRACADSSRIVYVASTGLDNGTCSDPDPCQSFAFALQQTNNTRNVIRVRGVTFDVGSAAVALALRTLFIDGDNTIITGNTAGPVFTVGSGTFTFEGLTLGAGGGSAESVAVSGGSVELFAMKLLAPAKATGGSLNIDRSIVTGGLQCTGSGAIEVSSNSINGNVSSSGCTAMFDGNRFIDTPSDVGVDGSQAILQNNVFLAHNSFSDGLVISNGATARFNTFVNTSGTDSGAAPLWCNGTVDATSNIIAWHSSMIPCAGKYTLFDEVAGNRPGTGNATANVSTFFVDLANEDFHLAPNSPAIGVAEPGLPVTTDADGHARPDPSGSMPDVGAYEAP